MSILPARFLRPWEVLEMDIQDLHQTSSAGNRYLLVALSGLLGGLSFYQQYLKAVYLDQVFHRTHREKTNQGYLKP